MSTHDDSVRRYGRLGIGKDGLAGGGSYDAGSVIYVVHTDVLHGILDHFEKDVDPNLVASGQTMSKDQRIETLVNGLVDAFDHFIRGVVRNVQEGRELDSFRADLADLDKHMKKLLDDESDEGE